MKKNDIISLSVAGMTAEGRGVGRHEGMAVFVPGTAPGDKLQCRVVKVLKSYAFGIIEQLDTPSPDRQEADCPYSSKCGGCVYRHMTYAAECDVKEDRVRDALTRIGGFRDLPILPILGDAGRRRYRNKAQIPLGTDTDGNLTMGFYGAHSHRIVNMEDCLLQPTEFTVAMEVFRKWHRGSAESVYDESLHKGVLRHLYLRSGEKNGQLMVCIVINGNTLNHAETLINMLKAALPGLTNVILNINRDKTNVVLGKTCRVLYGPAYITDTLCGLQFRLSPLSFYQVNRAQAERLYQKAADYAALTGKETLLDLYCGTGTIGLSLANRAKKLIGVEIVSEAVENARENAMLNGISNAEFLCADAAGAAKQLASRGETPQVVLLDPPRKGCEEALLHTVAAMAPDRIVYISCDPATLARDLKLFAALGYPPVEASPVDLFPGTAHVESIVLMQRSAN